MSELLRKFFEDAVSPEKDACKAVKRLEIQTDSLIEPYVGRFDNESIEIIRNLMYGILIKAEQEGFQLGVKYTLKILSELFTDL